MYRTCRHVMATGHECQSPALKDAFFCYFHFRLRKRQHTAQSAIHARERAEAKLAAQAEQKRLDQLVLDLGFNEIKDPATLQVSLSLLLTAIAENVLTKERARPLLAGLEFSLRNLEIADESTKGATARRHPRPL